MSETSFAGPLGTITLRAHAGSGGDGQGALIYFHGGAASAASFAASAPLCDAIARESASHVLALDSTLITTPKFPDVIDQAYFAVCHVHEHADDFGADHRQIAIGGEGFGAALATAVARLAKERRNPALALQVLIDPLLDLREASGPLQAFVERYLPSAQQRSDPRASPGLATNLIGLPPTLLVTTSDAQRAQVAGYASALRKAYVPAEVTHARGDAAQHDCVHACARALRTGIAG